MTDVATEASGVSESVVAGVMTGSEPKLWAGKYKTPEELESAYKNVAGTYEENKSIKQKLEDATKVPDDYSSPDGIQLRAAELEEIKTIAKNAGLTQAQFERTAREMQNRIASNLDKLDLAKKEIGDEKLAILNDYVKKYYPENLQGAVLNQILKDKNALNDALKDRDSKLNSQVPGMSNADPAGTPKKYDGEADMIKARDNYIKNPNANNRKKYIDLAAEVGSERFKDKLSRG